MKRVLITLSSIIMVSCGGGKMSYDASGTFEAVEVTVSAEVSGKLLSFDVQQGMSVDGGVELGLIDTVQLYLKKLQASRGVNATENRKADIAAQIAATRAQIANARTEKARVERLVAAGAAGTQQLDNITTQLEVFESQLRAQLSSLGRGNQSISDEVLSQTAQIAQIEDQIGRSIISSPIKGTVLVKYAEQGEYVMPGKPLFDVANIDTLNLRAYVTSDQLAQLKLGQPVKVFANYGENDKEYNGKIIWIADKAEFTPKTIQTPDERANLVYALKIAVPNDGLLKIGMYGDVKFSQK